MSVRLRWKHRPLTSFVQLCLITNYLRPSKLRRASSTWRLKHEGGKKLCFWHGLLQNVEDFVYKLQTSLCVGQCNGHFNLPRLCPKPLAIWEGRVQSFSAAVSKQQIRNNPECLNKNSTKFKNACQTPLYVSILPPLALNFKLLKCTPDHFGVLLLCNDFQLGTPSTPTRISANHAAHQRQAEFTHPSVPFTNGTELRNRKRTFHRGIAKPQDTENHLSNFIVVILIDTLQAITIRQFLHVAAGPSFNGLSKLQTHAPASSNWCVPSTGAVFNSSLLPRKT